MAIEWEWKAKAINFAFSHSPGTFHKMGILGLREEGQFVGRAHSLPDTPQRQSRLSKSVRSTRDFFVLFSPKSLPASSSTIFCCPRANYHPSFCWWFWLCPLPAGNGRNLEDVYWPKNAFNSFIFHSLPKMFMPNSQGHRWGVTLPPLIHGGKKFGTFCALSLNSPGMARLRRGRGATGTMSFGGADGWPMGEGAQQNGTCNWESKYIEEKERNFCK